MSILFSRGYVSPATIVSLQLKLVSLVLDPSRGGGGSESMGKNLGSRVLSNTSAVNCKSCRSCWRKGQVRKKVKETCETRFRQVFDFYWVLWRLESGKESVCG
jgi:hypothetical protein